MKFRFILILILFISIKLLAKETNDPYDLTCEAIDLITELRFDDAIEKTKFALEIDSTYSTGLIILSDLYFLKGDYENALLFINKDINNSSAQYSSSTMLSKAKILFYSNKIDQFKSYLKSIEEIDFILKHNVAINGFYIHKCESYIYNEDWEKAEEILNLAIDAIRNNYWNTFYQFIINVHNKDYPKSINNISELDLPKYKSKINFLRSRLTLSKILEKLEMNETQKLLYFLLLYQFDKDNKYYLEQIDEKNNSEIVNNFYLNYKNDFSEKYRLLLEDYIKSK